MVWYNLAMMIRSLRSSCRAGGVSTALLCALLTGGVTPLHASQYSWQNPHAQVTLSGDLLWQPQPFAFTTGASVKYIDYENGNDANAGTQAAPWQHHPWDANASGNAAAASGIHTYVFKRGVVYRGTLTIKHSGTPVNPIRLTSDPSWGSGEAHWLASEVLTSGWQRGGHPLMPNSNLVWHIDLPFAPRRVWLLDGTNITRLALARTPNWKESNPEDVKSEWWYWRNVQDAYIDGSKYYKGIDATDLTQPESYYSNAVIWAEYFPVMGTPYAAKVMAFDSVNKGLVFRGPWGDSHRPAQYNRFFLEDMPQYLDSTNEFWFDKSGEGGRLYVLLPAEREPNGAQIEAARHMHHLYGTIVSNIEISGLTFMFNNAYWDLTAQFFAHNDVANAAVRVHGSADGVAVTHCRFAHVTRAVRCKVSGNNYVIDRLRITDNDIAETDHGAISLEEFSSPVPPYGPLKHVDILRNRLFRVGVRPYPPTHGHAINVEFPATAEIAGNILDRMWGAGLFIFGGKSSGNVQRDVPFTRILIHHNNITDPLLNCNDWGGLETWQGGPFMVYNNISGNPGGYWNPSHKWRESSPASQRTHSTARFGFAYYLDGAFKNYVFNNVAWGKNNDLTSPLCNCAAFQSVLGFQNMHLNNTVHKFGCGIRRNSECSGRNQYLGNLFSDISDWQYFYDYWNVSEAAYDYRNLAFSQNVFHQLARTFGVFEYNRTTRATFDAFRSALTSRNAMQNQLGQISTNSPLRNAAARDFRLAAGTPAIDAGARAFVPWPLYRTVAEWHFWRDKTNPNFILDDHWYMNNTYSNRDMYYATRRFHLTGVNLSAASYQNGPLENWCAGALALNGADQYAYVTHPASGLTLCASTNNFIIEAYFRTVPGHTNSIVVAKMDSTNGYALEIDQYGCALLRVRYGGQDCAKPSSMLVNDGQWHHVIAEFDRYYGMWLYVDGAKCSMYPSGTMPLPGTTIATPATLYVGGTPQGGRFAGTLEYVRLSVGALRDAKTTIDELYEWQFNGPALRDFFGRAPLGARDAGAFEWHAHDDSTNLAPPRIVTHPQDIFVFDSFAGTLHTHTDDASSYQWRRNGALLAGATNSRVAIANASAASAGYYDVIAINAAGAATSTPAWVTIVPEPAAFMLLLGCFALARRT